MSIPPFEYLRSEIESFVSAIFDRYFLSSFSRHEYLDLRLHMEGIGT